MKDSHIDPSFQDTGRLNERADVVSKRPVPVYPVRPRRHTAAKVMGAIAVVGLAAFGGWVAAHGPVPDWSAIGEPVQSSLTVASPLADELADQRARDQQPDAPRITWPMGPAVSEGDAARAGGDAGYVDEPAAYYSNAYPPSALDSQDYSQPLPPANEPDDEPETPYDDPSGF